jgi:FkbM family methyltransferase
MEKRLQDFFRGLKANLKFSNRLQLIYDRLFRRNLPVTHYIWKNRFFFICNPGLGDHRSLQECLCERAYDDLLDKCQFPSNRIAYVNVGANIGAFDFLLVDRDLKLETGLAVELNPFTYLRCLLNFKINRLNSIHLVNAGVAGMNGWLKFQASANSRSDSIFAPSGILQNDAIDVELLTLETLLDKYAKPFAEFDLLKLDCEGAEYGIIRLSSVEILQRFRHILIEFHSEPENESVQVAYPTMVMSIMNQGMGGRPSKVAARGDWLVVRQFSVEKNWIARVTTSSPGRVVCLVRTESAIWVF